LVGLISHHFVLNLSEKDISRKLQIPGAIFQRGRLLAVSLRSAGLDLAGRIETEE
jgi:hypothetical protein